MILSWKVATLLGLILLTAVAGAQVIQAQHGSLVLEDNRASMFLSVPTSAFGGWDNDGNRILSPSEFVMHRGAFVADILRKLTLRDTSGSRRLQNITLTAAAPDHAPPQSMTQLLITGHFELEDASGPLRLSVNLFGITEDEKQVHIDVIESASDNRVRLVFTPSMRTAGFQQEGD